MIRIQKEDIDKVAAFWAQEVKAFLTTALDDKHQVRYKDRAGNINSFGTRLEKFRFIYFDKTQPIAGLSDDVKNRVWRIIEDLLSSDAFLKGNKRLCETWAKRQNRYLRNEELKTVVKDIFISIYDGVSGNSAYDVFEKLGLRTCPYCNRHYAFTLKSAKGKFKTRPEFDHFYDKSTYPMLAVTFFNLVPSCKECNHGKGIKEVGRNPYFDDFQAKFILTKPISEDKTVSKVEELNINEILNLSNESEFSLDFKMPTNEMVKAAEAKNIENLGLRPLYNMHKDYVMEIVEKVSAYNVLARDGIVERFQGIYHTETDVYNLIFGRYLSDAEQPNRPLSKLTADILDQLHLRPND